MRERSGWKEYGVEAESCEGGAASLGGLPRRCILTDM
jgi:hypothetical protein